MTDRWQPHNPILRTQSVERGVLALARAWEFPSASVALVYNGHMLMAELPYNKQPGYNLRSTATHVYFVDKSVRQAHFNVSVPGRIRTDVFPFSIDVTYQVDNAPMMIEQRISDTVDMIGTKLEEILHHRAQYFALNFYPNFVREVRGGIGQTASFFPSMGLRLLNCRVDVVRSEAFDKRVAELDQIEQARQVAQPFEFTAADLPSRQYGSTFIVTVRGAFFASDPKAFRAANLGTAQTMLRNEIVAKMRSICYGYTMTSESDLEKELSKALREGDYQCGLNIDHLQVEVQLPKAARDHFEQLQQMNYKGQISNYTLHNQGQQLNYYLNLMNSQNGMALLADELARNPDKALTVYQELNGREQQAHKDAFEAFKILANTNQLSEVEGFEMSKTIMKILQTRYTSQPNNQPSLPPLNSSTGPFNVPNPALPNPSFNQQLALLPNQALPVSGEPNLPPNRPNQPTSSTNSPSPDPESAPLPATDKNPSGQE